jgi:hypothetical protein
MLGVVHVVVSRNAAKDRLPKHPAEAWRPFPPVRAPARLSPAVAESPSAS